VDALNVQWADARLTVFAVQTEITGNTVRLTVCSQPSRPKPSKRNQAARRAGCQRHHRTVKTCNQWALVKRGVEPAPRAGSGAGVKQDCSVNPSSAQDGGQGWWFAPAGRWLLGYWSISLYVCIATKRARTAPADALVGELATHSGLLVPGNAAGGIARSRLPFGARGGG
jgi:hypothetical protein